MNFVVMIGRVGQDPELKYFESGSVKARFSLAVDRNVSRENRLTDWFNVEVWGRQAEFVGEWVKKGQLLSLQGAIEVQTWTDNTGNVRETPIVRATELRLEGSKRDNQAPMAGAGAGGYSRGGSGNSGMMDGPVPF